MSFFGKMFGGKKEPTLTTGDAIQKLRETENMLLKKEEFLEKKIELELAEAKKNGTKNKRGNLFSQVDCSDLTLFQLILFSFVVYTLKHLFFQWFLQCIFHTTVYSFDLSCLCCRLRNPMTHRKKFSIVFKKMVTDDCLYRFIYLL